MNNEIVIAILFVTFGWKIALLYTVFGLLTAIIGGYLVDKISRDDNILISTQFFTSSGKVYIAKPPFKKRINEAWKNAIKVIKEIYLLCDCWYIYWCCYTWFCTS